MDDSGGYEEYDSDSPPPTEAASPRQLRGPHEGLLRDQPPRAPGDDEYIGQMLITRVEYEDKPQRDLPDEDAPKAVTAQDLKKMREKVHRPFAAIRGHINAKMIAETHDKHVRQVVDVYKRLQDKEERAYRRVNFHPRRYLVPADPKRKDKAIIEAISRDKNERWRRALFSGVEPSEINEGIVTRPKLKSEHARVKRLHPPVFYYGT
jgi:hypothetical protein